ncbi:MAG TPA: hypothetical protein VFE62_00370, partial [Gemmataceae bacterium]|nr:hypothetical protein [Gemmataceae bacterium]
CMRLAISHEHWRPIRILGIAWNGMRLIAQKPPLNAPSFAIFSAILLNHSSLIRAGSLVPAGMLLS